MYDPWIQFMVLIGSWVVLFVVAWRVRVYLPAGVQIPWWYIVLPGILAAVDTSAAVQVLTVAVLGVLLSAAIWPDYQRDESIERRLRLSGERLVRVSMRTISSWGCFERFFCTACHSMFIADGAIGDNTRMIDGVRVPQCPICGGVRKDAGNDPCEAS